MDPALPGKSGLVESKTRSQMTPNVLIARSRREDESREDYACALRASLEEHINELFLEETAVTLVPEQTSASSFTKPRASRPRASQAKGFTEVAPSARVALQDQPGKLVWEESYKRTSGAAGGEGNDFEWGMLSLVYLRMLAAGNDFQLATNMEAAGKFDDIVVRYRTEPDGKWHVALIQLKFKKNSEVPKNEFLGLDKDYSLVKYCASYYETRTTTDKYLKSWGDFDDYQFILFTTGKVEGDSIEPETDLFKAGGDVVRFIPDSDIFKELGEWTVLKKALTELREEIENDRNDILGVGKSFKDRIGKLTFKNKVVNSLKMELLKSLTFENVDKQLGKLKDVPDEKTSFAEFLSKLQIYTSQASGPELNTIIKQELATVWKSSGNAEAEADAEAMFLGLQVEMKAWSKNPNGTFLAHTSPLWLDLVDKRLEKLSSHATTGANFVPDCLAPLTGLIERATLRRGIPCSGVLSVRVESLTGATAAKLRQALGAKGVLYVNVQTLLDREADVLAAWAGRWCHKLVVECDLDVQVEDATRIAGEMTRVVEGVGKGTKLLVLITREKHELNLRLGGAISEVYKDVNFKWEVDLTKESRETMLSTKIKFRGTSKTLSDLVYDEEKFFSEVDLDVISQLLQSGKQQCGQKLDGAGETFVSRRLRRSVGGEAFRVDSVRDVADRVVLLVAEPGMGKSTLIAHLAQVAKDNDLKAGIVNVRLNDCTQYLSEIDPKNCTKIAVNTFLEQAALEPGNSLEKSLFRSSHRRRLVFVDGVDEVCPLYEEEVLALLKWLKESDVVQLWVTSRPLFQQKLEEHLCVGKVQTVNLETFSDEDQAEYFKKVWTAKIAKNLELLGSQISGEESTKVKEEMAEKVKNLTDKLPELIQTLLSALGGTLGKDDPISGIPLMAAMMAVTFEDRVIAAISAKRRRQITDNFDVIHLYAAFVDKKIDIYYTEKKKAKDRTLVTNVRDENKSRDYFLQNHRLASLRVLQFNPEEIAGLEFDGKEELNKNLEEYLKEVADGWEKLGIIYKVGDDGVPHFVHRTLAEYFAASWLHLNYKTNRALVERITFEPGFKLVCEMFNRFMAAAGNHPLHAAVLNRDLEATRLALLSNPSSVNDLDEGGRTPLHLAVLLSGMERHPDCLRIVKLLLCEGKAQVDIADFVLGWRPLQYADRAQAWKAAVEILGKGGNEDDMIRQPALTKFVDFMKLSEKSIPDPGLMVAAARDASIGLVRYLAEDRGGNVHWFGPEPLKETMAHRAAEAGNVALLKYLVAKGVSLIATNSKNATVLHYAARQDTTPVVSFLVHHGVELNAVDQDGFTAFQVATQRGAHDVMAVLVLKGASYQVPGGIELSATQLNASLLCATVAGNQEWVQYLLDEGASEVCRDGHGNSAIRVAMDRGHKKLMEFLLLHGCPTGCKLLHAACRKGETDVASYLLSSGSDVDAKDEDGRTALYVESSEGHLDTTKLLVEMEASLVGCKKGWTPLHVAASKDHVAIVQLLVNKFKNIDLKEVDGRTALYISSEHGHLDTTKLLVEMGASLLGAKDGYTPLHVAASKGHVTIVEFLANKFENIDLEVDGRTALYISSEHGHLDTTKWLVDKGASLVGGEHGRTPLYIAAMNGHVDVVKFLVNKVENIDLTTKDDFTALYYASSQGHQDVVEVLLKNGAGLVADQSGYTPLHRAAKNGHLAVVKLLVNKFKNNIDLVTVNGYTALRLALDGGYLDIAKHLKKNGASSKAARMD